jgi:hypothetical protein
MATNFQISVHRNSEKLHVKLTGDFDGTSGHGLLKTLFLSRSLCLPYLRSLNQEHLFHLIFHEDGVEHNIIGLYPLPDLSMARLFVLFLKI